MLDHFLHLVAHAGQLGGEQVRGAGAEQRFLVDDHHGLGGLARKRVHDVEVVDRRAGDHLVARREAERVLQAALDDRVGDADVDHVRDVVLGRGLRGGKADRACVGADDRRYARLVHLLDLGDADLGLGLRVAQHRLELRAAHRLDAAGGVDFLDRHRRADAAQVARIGERPGDRMQDADLDRRGLRRGRWPESRRGPVAAAAAVTAAEPFPFLCFYFFFFVFLFLVVFGFPAALVASRRPRLLFQPAPSSSWVFFGGPLVFGGLVPVPPPPSPFPRGPLQILAATAHVDEAAVKPLPNSRKVYVEGSRPDIRVPMREISQSDTPASFGAEKNPPIYRLRLLRAVHRPGGENRHPLGPGAAARALDRGARRHRGARRSDFALRPRAARRSRSWPSCASTCSASRAAPSPGRTSRRCTTRARASSRRRWSSSRSARTSAGDRRDGSNC